jgi:hypothetical protein
MHGSPSPNHAFARSLVQTVFLVLAAAFTATATKGAPAWPALLELPAYPGVSSPGSPGFPGLPEVLRHFDFDASQPDGEPVRDAADWWLQRRPEVMAMLRHYMYGEEPPAPADIAFTVQSVDTGALNGLATRKIIVGDFAPAGTAPFRFVLYLPNDRAGPVPVLLALNAQGEARIEPGADRANRWDLPGAMEAGVAIATVEVREFASDGGGFRDALINPLAAAGFEGDWKGIAAWAWGLARVVDYLVTDPAIDPCRIGVTGYSRRGKAALWAGALDDRMALVIPHQSGHGGAHSSRRRWGGTFGTQFPHWFLDRYVYVDAADYDRLPFDQHFVIAAIAPRRVLLSENRSYGDNLNGMLAMMAGARPVWALLGSDPETGVHLEWDTDATHQHLPRHWAYKFTAVKNLPRGGVEGFREWAQAVGLLANEHSETQARAAMGRLFTSDGGSALEAYWLGRSEGEGFDTRLSLHSNDAGNLRVSLPARRDAVGAPGLGAHWRGVEQWLETAPSPEGPWRTLARHEIAAAEIEETGHPHAVRVHLALKKEPTAQPRFFRLRYAIRYEDGPLQIIRHPADQTVMEGERVSFAVELNGRPISAAEWRHNGVPLPGEHHTFLSLREVVPGDSGYYSYHAWKGDAEVSSLPALLNVIPNTTAAHILKARFVAPEYVKIRFSEAVAAGGGPHGAENPANYQFSDGLTVVTAAFAEGDPTRVRLRVAGAILGEDYTLTVSALANRAATPVLSPLQDLLLRQDAVVRINFQPASPPPPPGWLIDHGALFGPRAGGWTYGWAGEPGTARQRNSSASPDFLHDTLIHAGPQQFADDPDWSIALPNGTYRVSLVLGDPQYFDNEFSVLAQGKLILSGTANRDLRWIEGTALVEVTDGTLTLSKGASARRNKFAFIEIRLAPGL